MNTRKLSHFLAVVETRNLRAAAESVHLSQPALSRSLKSLEDDLGILLLDRAYSRIEPTTYSTPVVTHIRKLVSEARALREAVRRLKGLEEGEIRIGFGPFAAAVALQQVAADLVSRYPKLALRIELANSPLLVELLQQDRLDLVVCDSRYLVEREDDMTVIPLRKQKIAFVAGRKNPLHRHEGRIRLVDLKDHPIGAPTLPAEMLSAFRGHGFKDIPSLTCDEIRVLFELAANSPLIVMVPQLAVDRLGEGHDVAALPVDLPFDAHAHTCIIHACDRTLGPAANLVLDLVRERLTDEPLPRRASAKRLRNGAGTAAKKRAGP